MCWAGWLGVVTATAALIVVLEEAAPQSLSFFLGLTRSHAKGYVMPTWHTYAHKLKQKKTCILGTFLI